MRGTGSPVVLAVFLNIPFNFIVHLLKTLKLVRTENLLIQGLITYTIILDIKSFVILKFSLLI